MVAKILYDNTENSPPDPSPTMKRAANMNHLCEELNDGKNPQSKLPTAISKIPKPAGCFVESVFWFQSPKSVVESVDPMEYDEIIQPKKSKFAVGSS